MDGNAETPVAFTISPVQAGSKVVEVLMASRTRADVGDLVATTGYAKLDATANGWTVALSNDTAAIDDSVNGGVGSGARILGTSGNVGVMLKRVRLTRTLLLDSLRGWERVFLRCRTSAASRWEISFRWVASLADPVQETNVSVIHDTQGALVWGYAELDLGHIRIPEEGALAGVALEIWARRISGTGDLHMNFIRNLPATPGKDVLTRIVVPGSGRESWLGSGLVTPSFPTGYLAGTVSGNDLVLDAINEGGATPPNAGLVWGVGTHRVTFDFTTTTPSYTYQVYNQTDSNSPAAVSVSSSPSGRLRKSLVFAGVAGKAYQPQFRLDSSTGSTRLHSITHEMVPVLAQNEQAHTEPESGIIHKRDSSGNHVGILANEGEGPFWVQPGSACVFIIPFDVPKAGYSEPESVKARTVTVTAVGAPRFTG